MGLCLGLEGVSEPIGSNHTLEQDKISSVDGSQLLNVETTTPQGIKRGEKLKLIQKNYADYIVTQHLPSAAEIFTAYRRGR